MVCAICQQYAPSINTIYQQYAPSINTIYQQYAPSINTIYQQYAPSIIYAPSHNFDIFYLYLRLVQRQGAFLLLVGTFTSAVNVSQDGELRKVFRKSAIAHLNLLRTIGIAQMEKELVKTSNRPKNVMLT
jgi:hypothetical protein